MKISAEHVESIIGSSIDGINSVLENLRSLFLFENVLDSIKFGVILYAVTFIGKALQPSLNCRYYFKDVCAIF